jgi:glycosyltransferase involved in cell wall biosynthesis
MKVLFIIGQNAGGLPHYTAELANAVAEHADVTVLKPVKTTADDLFDEDMTVVDLFETIDISMPKIYKVDINPLKFLRGIVSYNNLEQVKEMDPDIIHVTTGLFPHVKLFAWLHDISEAAPLIVTKHEVPSDPFSLSRPPVFAEQLLNTAIPKPDVEKVIVHTENQKKALAGHGCDSDRIEVIPHGAYSVFGDHEDIDVQPEPNTVLFFGNVVPPKGIDTIVEAIPKVKREIPDVKLIVAGDGRIPPKSKSTIEEHPENFEIHNYFIPNEEVKEFFTRTEIVALPYRNQGGTKGHSGALATAYSFGKPIVSSSAGDFPRLVGETDCGIVVPPEDPVRLADAVQRVLINSEAKERMAANSRQMAEMLSWENIAERHLELYADVSSGTVLNKITRST